MMSINIIKIIIAIFLSLSLNAYSEYRAYQYLVYDELYPEMKPSIVKTSMNPQTYKAYKGGHTLKINLMSTWMCYGSTSKKDMCPSPTQLSESKQ